MKIRFFFAAALVALLSSCQGDYCETPDASASSSETQEKVTLTISLSTPLTRATLASGNTDDMTFHNAQVFVYNKQGVLEAKSGPVTSQTGINLSIIPGHKTVWAVVNAPELSLSVGTSDTPSLIRTSLSDNSLDALVMSGSKDLEITASSSESIEVKHIASKIILNKITRSFTNTDLSEVPMTLKKVYMSNVAADCDYGCTGTEPTVWNCKMGVLASPVENAALLLDTGLNGNLSEGATYSTAHTFYVYPNPVTADTDAATWAPRKTRLVLECDYNGRTCYYPITIQGTSLERNKVYQINGLTLKRPGSESSERKEPEVSSDVDCTFSITVANWEEGIAPYDEVF